MTLEDPAAGSPWSRPETVAGFTKSPPNAELLRFAAAELLRAPSGAAVDLGCGAGRNAIPLTAQGWRVVGLDYSAPMLSAAVGRARATPQPDKFHAMLASMDALPLRDGCADLVIAHGIWNLARSAVEFRRALREAARIGKTGAGLFVFTFSRNTLGAEAQPLGGQAFVFTEFSGQPQCFLTQDQLVSELAAVGFEPDPFVPLRELNKPRPGETCLGQVPVIYEAGFRLRR